ncbi:PR-1-like protein [Daedalea quercina L-15889]|uniref:PR-1-like protein n=1 Tax=Daedalea quercina L-15889 TaxID=1314783 RepID=A0A165UBW7_9APHY|nr:PR-1-like protein [Daedalea quercina L-15889]
MLLVFLAVAIVLVLTPGGLAALVHGHRYHRHPDLKKRTIEGVYDRDLTPRHVRKVKRQSCRVTPTSSFNTTIASVTQPIPSDSNSALALTSSASVQAEIATTPAASSPSSSLAITPDVQQDPSPAPGTTSAEPAPTTSGTPTSTTSQALPPPTSSLTSEAAPTSSASSSSGSSGSTSQSDIDEYLNDHNTARAQYGAAPLTWNDTLAAAAQQWANGCVFQHSGGTLGPYGENLAAGTGDEYGIDQAIQSWTNESSQYNPNSPEASHFTQVVWKATTQVGCAEQDCNGIFPASYGEAHYYVCEYYPQGNVIGEFAQNVQA